MKIEQYDNNCLLFLYTKVLFKCHNHLFCFKEKDPHQKSAEVYNQVIGQWMDNVLLFIAMPGARGAARQ